jgi:hypothetical protein
VPPASMPMISTDASPMKGWNMPMAFDPPPTQAMTASGRRPVPLEDLLARPPCRSRNAAHAPGTGRDAAPPPNR